MIGLAGLPDAREARRLVLAICVDTVGVGLFLPLAFYFFTVTTSLSVAGIGLAMSAATLTALLASPACGALTDRWGAKRMVVASNLLVAAGYLCYPLASSYPAIFAAVLVVMAADRLYYASAPTLVTAIARTDQLDAWFALTQAVTAAGVGAGALISTVFLVSGGVGTLKAIVVVNAATSVLAAALTASVRLPASRPDRRDRSGHADPRGSMRAVLTDRPFRRLILAQLLLATALTVPAAFLPLYLTRVLHLGQWQITLAFTVNCALLVGLQLRITHGVRSVRRTRVVLAGAALFLVSFCLTGLAVLAAGGEWWLASGFVFAGVVVYAVGDMLATPSANALAARMAPDALRGRYMSLFQVTGAIAFGLGPGLVGWLFDVWPPATLLVTGGCVSLGAALFLSVERMIAAPLLHRVPPAPPHLGRQR